MGFFAALLLLTEPGTRVVDEAVTSLGATYTVRSDTAPFPAAGGGARRRARYNDDTVMVFVPSAWCAPADGGVDSVVFYHGHFDTAANAMVSKRLREQLVKSRKQAWLVVPQLARDAHDSSAGQLEKPDGLRRLLEAVFGVVARRPQRRCGEAVSRVPLVPKLGAVVVAAHSGGFQGAAFAVSKGGVAVRDVVLFDALYGFSARFSRWLADDPARRLTHVYRPGPGNRMVVKWTKSLEKALRYHDVPFVEREGGRFVVVPERVLFLRTDVPHGDVPAANDLFGEWLYHAPLRAPSVR